MQVQKDRFLSQLLVTYQQVNLIKYMQPDVLYCRAVSLKAIHKAIVPAMSLKDFKENILSIRKDMYAHPEGYTFEFGYARDQKLAIAIGSERLSSLTVYNYEIR